MRRARSSPSPVHHIAAVFLLLACPVPGLAADDDDSGLVVRAEGWWVAPQNADIDYAFAGVGSLASGGELRTLSQDRDALPMVYAGWRLSTSHATRIGARFWEYDDTSRAETGTQPQDIGPLLASPTLLASVNFFGFLTADSASASSRLRAIQVDAGADWSQELSGGGTLRFAAGARLFRYERTTTVVYDEDTGSLKELFVNESSEARGIGPRAAVAYDHRFGRVEVGALLGLALPLGELEGINRQEFTVDGSLDIATEVTRPGTTEAFPQLDGEFRLSFDLVRGLSASATYAFQYWAGVQSSYRFVAAGTATAVPVDEDVVFEGLSVGMRYEF